MVATAGNEEIDCESFQGYEEYGNDMFVVCEKFGEIPLETCENCPENDLSGEDDRPSYIL